MSPEERDLILQQIDALTSQVVELSHWLREAMAGVPAMVEQCHTALAQMQVLHESIMRFDFPLKEDWQLGAE